MAEMTDQEFLDAIEALGKLVDMEPAPIAPSRKRRGTFADESDTWLAWWEIWAGDVDLMQESLARLMPMILSAAESSSLALIAANYKGNWSDLSGALTQPASVKHNNQYWLLNTDLADITQSEPSVSTDWQEYTLEISSITGLADALNGKAGFNDLNAKLDKSNPSIEGSLTEEIYNLTGTVIDPSNGTIQTKMLSANTTFTEELENGQSVTLMIDDGSAYAVTWPSVIWKTDSGVAPTLNRNGYTVVVLFKVNAVLYGARVGDA